jgi:hypothetical protein
MRVLHRALLAVMLLGCDAESDDPVQPQFERARSAESVGGNDASTDAAVTATSIGETRGFFTAGANRVVTLGTEFSEITKLELPPGDYIANVSAVFAASGELVRLVDCVFTVGGLPRGQQTKGMVGGLGPNNFTTLPHTIGVTLAERADLGVACRTELAGSGVVSQPSHLTAIRLDRLTARR